jgi:hypothetical protein
MDLNLSSVQTAITKSIGRSGLVLGKYSPQILLGVGIVGSVVSTVLAARATLQLEPIVEEHQETIKLIKSGKEHAEAADYTDEEYTKDLVTTYAKTGLKLGTLYGPAVGIGVGSIACVLGAHGIMSKRNVGLAAAYNVVSQAFSSYRSRVVEEQGEDVDRNYRHGLRDEMVTETTKDETGQIVKAKKKVKKIIDGRMVSEYARFFDQTSTMYRPDASQNLYFLKAQQTYANERLKAVGHIFLNEIYESLGMEHTQAGAVVGWVLNDDGDNFIDFGIYNVESDPARAFVNGLERAILLDFNVDGVIWNLI